MLHKVISVLYISITLQVVLCKVFQFKDSKWPPECNDFFYMGKSPQNIPGNLDDYVVIVQMFNEHVHYCTLYNTQDKIAVFSAYQMHIGKGDEGGRQNTWYVEPQLSVATEGDNMNTFKATDLPEQAINYDYKLAYMDKGHLNPNFFQTGEGRKATFTLTNAVPQHPAFNRLYWFELEKQTKKIMYKYCFDIQGTPVDEIEDDEDADEESTGVTDTGKAYLITGAIPSGDKHLQTLKYEGKVNIPSFMFTAACCFKPKKPMESFSFAYLGLNEADTRIQVLNVANLEEFLKQFWPKNVPVRKNLDLFKNSCDLATKTGDQVIEEIDVALRHQAKMRYEKDKTFLYTEKMEID